MKSLSASSLHPNLQRSTERKAPENNTEQSTERQARRIEQLRMRLQQRKRMVPTQQTAAKAEAKAALAKIKGMLAELEGGLVQQISTASLRLLEQIDEKVGERYPEEEDLERLLEYRVRLSTDDDEIREQVMGLLEITPVPGQEPTSARMTRRKYQEIIDRMQTKLEKCIINQQRLIEERKQWERKTERTIKQPKQSVLGDRYQRQNQILIEENLKLANRSLETTSENSSLKEKLRVSQQQIESLAHQARASSNTIEKLQVRLNMPDRKILDENRKLQLIIQQLKGNNGALQERIGNLESQLSQITSRIYSSSAELDCSRRQGEQLRQQLETALLKAAEDQNKYLYLENLFKMSQDQKDELSRVLSQQLKEVSDVRKSEADCAARNRKLEDNISELNEQIQELKERNQRLEKNIEQAVEESKDEQMQLIREAQNRESLQRDKLLLAERLSNLESLLEAMRKQKNSAIEQGRRFQQTLTSLRAENIQLITALKGKEFQLDQLQLEVQQMKAQITTKTNKIESSKKKQQLNKKHAEQKAQIQQIYSSKLEILSREVSLALAELQSIREGYQNKRRLQQTRLKIVKEKFVQQVISVIEKGKSKKDQVFSVAQRLVDSFSNISHKESIITRLKEEKSELSREISQLKTKILKLQDPKGRKVDMKQSIKVKVDKKLIQTESQIKEFSNQLIAQRAKIEKGNADERLKVADETICSMESHIRKLQQQRELLEKYQAQLISKNKQLQRKGKNDKTEQHFKSIQQTFQAENQQLKHDINLVRVELQETRKDRDELREDTKYKKQYINTLKKDIKDLQNKLKQVNVQLQQQREEHSKTKKTVKQFQRKQQVVKDNRQKIEASRILERENAQLKRIIDQRAKQYKIQLSKRDNTIKLLKQKQMCSESLMKESRNDINNTQMLQQQLNSQIRKARAEIDRKDSLIKNLKEKLQKIQDAAEKERRQAQKKGSKDRIDIDRESKKVEQLKLQVKKLDSEIFSFRNVLKKLGKLLIQDKKTQSGTATPIKLSQLSLYQQGLSILQIKPDDLKDFLPQAQKQNKNTSNIHMSELEKVLSNEDFDPSAAFTLLSSIVQESKRN